MLKMFFHSIIVIHKTKQARLGYIIQIRLSVNIFTVSLRPMEAHAAFHAPKTHTRQINEIYKFIMQPNACFICMSNVHFVVSCAQVEICSAYSQSLFCCCCFTKINMHGPSKIRNKVCRCCWWRLCCP